MSTTTSAYVEIIDFIAANNPEAVVAFHPSADAQQRLADLIHRDREGLLSPDERSELDHFIQLEHILRMAKAKARLMLARDI